MRRTRFFGGELIHRNKREVNLERQLLEEKSAKNMEEEALLEAYRERKMIVLPERPEDIISDYNKDSFGRIGLITEQTLVDVGYVGNLLLRKCLHDLARQGIARNCEYIINVDVKYFNGMSSKATSGFVVGIGGTGFGFTSPDGVYAAIMGMVGTGLVRIKKDVAVEDKVSDDNILDRKLIF